MSYRKTQSHRKVLGLHVKMHSTIVIHIMREREKGALRPINANRLYTDE